MFGTPWKRQPCRELGENHASFDSLYEQANDTGSEKVDPIMRSRGAQRSGGRVWHDGA